MRHGAPVDGKCSEPANGQSKSMLTLGPLFQPGGFQTKKRKRCPLRALRVYIASCGRRRTRQVTAGGEGGQRAWGGLWFEYYVLKQCPPVEGVSEGRAGVAVWERPDHVCHAPISSGALRAGWVVLSCRGEAGWGAGAAVRPMTNPLYHRPSTPPLPSPPSLLPAGHLLAVPPAAALQVHLQDLQLPHPHRGLVHVPHR